MLRPVDSLGRTADHVAAEVIQYEPVSGLEGPQGGCCEAQPDEMRSPSDAPELLAQLALGARQYAPSRL